MDVFLIPTLSREHLPCSEVKDTMKSRFCTGECIDLHTHSTASDGTFSPGELMVHAAARGLGAIALTDHDTVAGLREAGDAAIRLGIEFIPGVELSLNCDDFSPEGQMHLIGFFIDPENERLQQGLEFLRGKRQERVPRVLENLKDSGIELPGELLSRLAGESAVGRPHIASALVEMGAVKSMQEAFDVYLKKGAPGYVPKKKFDMHEAVPMIQDAGGIPILAHPKYLRMEYRQLSGLLDELKDIGLMGLEAYYSHHSDEETGEYLRMAREKELLISGGSDFHGSNKPDIELGTGKGNLCVPYSLLEDMKKKLKDG